MIYLFKKGASSLAPEFALDATIEEKRVDAYTVTNKAIETGANVSDHVWAEPKEYSGSGIITASPLGEAFSKDRIKKQFDALTSAADLRTEFTVVFGWWVFDAVLANLESTSNRDIGEALEFSFSFKEIWRAQYQTTQIPAIRLKPKVRRRRGKKPQGTAQTPKAPTGKNRAKGNAWKLSKALSGGKIS